MQQMVNLVPFLAPQAPQAQAPASGGQAPIPGLFQALLLEALTGAQAAAAPQPGQAAIPQVPAMQVPAMQVPAEVALTPQVPVPQTKPPQVPTVQVLASQAAPVPAPLPQPPVGQVPAAPGETPALPLRLTGPTPPAVPAEMQALPAEEEAVEQPEEAQPPAESAEVLQSQTQTQTLTQAQSPPPALQAEAVHLAQAQAAPPAPLQPQAAKPSSSPARTEALSAEAEPANPQLESFVQKAVRTVQEGQSAPETGDGKAQAQPTFQDLVKLVMEADKAARPSRPEAPAEVPAGKAEEILKVETDVPVTAGREAKVLFQEAPAVEAPQTPRQPVEPEQVLRQVSRFVKVMVDSKQSEVRLNLHPEHLGQIAVKLVVGDGALRANLVAQDVAVKAVLEANLDQLKTRLSDQGFQVEQVQVTVGGDSHSQNPRHGEQRQPQSQQQWRSRSDLAAGQQDDPGTGAQVKRQAPAPWMRSTGARLNSLA